MLKAIGLLLIIAAGTGIGFEKSRELVKREKTLEALLHIVLLLKGEIRCGNASLPDAFCEMAEKFSGEYKIFLKDAADQMRNGYGEPLGKIYRRCAEKMLAKHYLSQEEKEQFLSLGDRLGYLDREMQLRQLELYENQLIQCTLQLQKIIPEKRKIARSLGMMGGILLAVLVA